MEDNGKKYVWDDPFWVGIVVGCVVALAIGAAAYGPVSRYFQPPAAREFYRGAFHSCMGIAVNVINMPVTVAAEQCETLVVGWRAADMYGDDTPGFDWDEIVRRSD